jgi:hypothetical protein
MKTMLAVATMPFFAGCIDPSPIPSPHPPPSMVATIFSDDFELLPVGAPGAYSLDAPHGAFSVAQEGGLNVQIDFLQPLNQNGKCKSELGPRYMEKSVRYGRIPYLTERWHAATVTIPLDWERDGFKANILEFHGSEDPGESGLGRFGSLNLNIGGDDVYGWRTWNDQKIQTSNDNKLEFFRMRYERGAKYRFVFRTIFDWRRVGHGATQVWLRKDHGPVDMVFSEEGPNAYNDDEGPYFKFGLYCPSWNESDRYKYQFTVKHHSLLFERLRIVEGSATVDDLL